MKIILKNGQYIKLDDVKAEHEVRHFGAQYVSKSEWKKNVRDVNKSESSVVSDTKGKETKQKKRERNDKLKLKQRQ